MRGVMGTRPERARALGRLLVGAAGIAVVGLVAIGWNPSSTPKGVPHASGAQQVEAEMLPHGRGQPRPLVRGNLFPDGVVALTWDDGPDRETHALAQYLHHAKVSATFFVVAGWVPDVSEEPGAGAAIYRTGHRALPILGDLVALGHRLGNHTENHVLLAGAATSTIAEQLRENQRGIDPFLVSELRMFRAPGGAWDRAAADALDDPFFADAIGPVHWDIDEKDWDRSLYCRTGNRPDECEPGPVAGTRRVRADVVARRYVEQIERSRRGIVLLHDRVGDVGSRYALDLAQHLVPELDARGFVFAAPVLAFSPLRDRAARVEGDVTFVDVDGDRRADVCAGSASLTCSLARIDRTNALPAVALDGGSVTLDLPAGRDAFAFGDVNGDGHADLCAVGAERITCAVSDRKTGTLAAPARWTATRTRAQALWLADVDGDGRADACMRTSDGLACATSTGTAFREPRIWSKVLGKTGAPLAFADLDRDGRADACELVDSGVACALSKRHGFAPPTHWSYRGDFAAAGRSPALHLGDLNGDHRADVCIAVGHDVTCALSNGHTFKRASAWATVEGSALHLADINGDGRADLCVVDAGAVKCGLAP